MFLTPVLKSYALDEGLGQGLEGDRGPKGAASRVGFKLLTRDCTRQVQDQREVPSESPETASLDPSLPTPTSDLGFQSHED